MSRNPVYPSHEQKENGRWDGLRPPFRGDTASASPTNLYGERNRSIPYSRVDLGGRKPEGALDKNFRRLPAPLAGSPGKGGMGSRPVRFHKQEKKEEEGPSFPWRGRSEAPSHRGGEKKSLGRPVVGPLKKGRNSGHRGARVVLPTPSREAKKNGACYMGAEKENGRLELLESFSNDTPRERAEGGVKPQEEKKEKGGGGRPPAPLGKFLVPSSGKTGHRVVLLRSAGGEKKGRQ